MMDWKPRAWLIRVQACCLVKGSVVPVRGCAVPLRGPAVLVKGSEVPVRGSPVPVRGSLVPVRGSVVPVEPFPLHVAGLLLNGCAGAEEMPYESLRGPLRVAEEMPYGVVERWAWKYQGFKAQGGPVGNQMLSHAC